MLVTGGRVFADDGFIEADVHIQGATVTAVMPAGQAAPAPNLDERVIDASGCFVCPGLIDLHFHGCMGSDFCDGSEEGIAVIARYQASRGVTSICPATMTYPEERLAPAMEAAARFQPKDDEASLVGINMEGPFISPNKVGAQNPSYVMPCDAAMLHRLQKRAGGLVKLIGIAPEEPGALDFIREVSPDIIVSLAHTCADYDCACEAFEAGARHLTHMYNAMPGMSHRAPGPIIVAAERDDVVVELIADGVHVHPAMVRLAFRLFGSERVALISDSMRACGLGEGTFDLGGQDVLVEGRVAKLADGTISGSVTDLADCVKTAVSSMGIDPWDAIRSASSVPARVLGLDRPNSELHALDDPEPMQQSAVYAHRAARGRIQAGYQADLVLFDSNMNVQQVILRGKQI
ncbi:MAG: N-acetylglucosamine-6-phosphate deacetylase [Eggerthellaceae bacterium]|nr:N-acetylglucosamine-6-phosphate deacetylase [Eggerthellaceae bacterium]